jgi:hypothetical protein
VTHQRKTAADYGQLSLFAETVPAWLQPEDPQETKNQVNPSTSATDTEDDDDLSQFMHWLQKNRDSSDFQE